VGLELQSFVVAVILAAFFLADRLGGQDQLACHVYQVGLGFALAFLVVSATTAFLRPAESMSLADILELPSAQQSAALLGGNDNGDSARESGAIKAAAGIVLLIGGLAATTRWSTLPLGSALGGILLLFLGGGQGGGTDLTSLQSSALFSSFLGSSSEGRDIAHFVVMSLGTAALLAFGFWRWERGGESTVVAVVYAPE
jgi:hypothetical protein